jgi:prepilin-type N-terminal cleavage/methylation domain-containing protein
MKAVYHHRAGFTLAELLVVLGIFGVLVGLLIPAVMRVREAANRAVCANNLKQISLGVHSFHQTWRILPYDSQPGTFGPYGSQTHAWSWLALLLPYVDQENLYKKGKIPASTLYASRDVAAARVEVFLCPSDMAFGEGPRSDAADLGMWNEPYMDAGQTNYKGVGGANWDWGEARWHNPGTNGSWNAFTDGDGLFYRSDYRHKKKLTDIKDGLSSTFLVGEAVPARSKWCSWPYANNAVGTCAIAPNAVQEDGSPFDPWDWTNTYGFASSHRGGLYFAFADASVRFVTDAIELETYRALATIAGGETVAPP